MAGELIQLRNSVVSRRMEHHGWTFDPHPVAEQQMMDYGRGALRNIDNGYRGSARQLADPEAVPDGPPKLPDGTLVETT